MKFDVLLRHSDNPNLFHAEEKGQSVPKDAFHHVATIAASDRDEAYSLTQNGNPHLDNPTQTWARDARATLTSEGERLKCRRMNDSLRSLSVGDILIDDSGEMWMVDFSGWLKVENAERSYAVVEYDLPSETPTATPSPTEVTPRCPN